MAMFFMSLPWWARVKAQVTADAKYQRYVNSYPKGERLRFEKD
jgi:hypothetical protein